MAGYQRGAQRVDTLEFHIGTRGRIQTYDLPLRRRLLLFAELLGLIFAPNLYRISLLYHSFLQEGDMRYTIFGQHYHLLQNFLQ